MTVQKISPVIRVINKDFKHETVELKKNSKSQTNRVKIYVVFITTLIDRSIKHQNLLKKIVVFGMGSWNLISSYKNAHTSHWVDATEEKNSMPQQ